MVEAVRGGGACFSPLPWSILGGVAPRLLTLFTLIKFAVVLCCPMVVLAMYLVSVWQLDSRSVISLAVLFPEGMSLFGSLSFYGFVIQWV